MKQDIISLFSHSQREELARYISAIRQYKKLLIKDYSIILYGSFAAGRGKLWSDIDIAVISDSFVRISWETRLNILNNKLLPIINFVQSIGLTYNEYSNFEYPCVIHEIRTNGIKII